MAGRWVLILFASTLLAACTAFQAPKDETPVVWELDPVALAVEAVGTPVAATLLVARPTAVGALATTEMAYRQQRFERRYYARNHWADEPARMMHPHLVTAVEQAGLFETVLSMAASAPADYRLETELLELEHDFRERAGGVARIDLRARLIDLRTGTVIATRRFQSDADSTEATPPAAVAATNRALDHLLNDLIRWLSGVGPQ